MFGIYAIFYRWTGQEASKAGCCCASTFVLAGRWPLLMSGAALRSPLGFAASAFIRHSTGTGLGCAPTSHAAQSLISPRAGIPIRSLIGDLPTDVMSQLGAARSIPVHAVGSHDTASAVVAVPMQADAAAYISCGTWGLVGVEVERPVLTDEAREAGFALRSNQRGDPQG